MIDPKKQREARKRERDAMDASERQVRALEDIADTLECIRVDFIGMQHTLGAMARRP